MPGVLQWTKGTLHRPRVPVRKNKQPLGILHTGSLISQIRRRALRRTVWRFTTKYRQLRRRHHRWFSALPVVPKGVSFPGVYVPKRTIADNSIQYVHEEDPPPIANAGDARLPS